MHSRKPVRASDPTPSGPGAVAPPASGLIAMRIGREFGSPADFGAALQRALARGGERGATIVVALEDGNMAIHLAREDGPSWNRVPLLHLRRGEVPGDADWAAANAVLEKLERIR